MTVFRKAALERKKNHINGVLFDDAGKRQMKILLFCMLTIAMSLLFLSQKTIKVYTVAKSVVPFRESQKKESCFKFEDQKIKNINARKDELISLSLNKKDYLTGTVSRVSDDNYLCVKITKEISNETPIIKSGATVYLWKHERLWFFLFKKINGNANL